MTRCQNRYDHRLRDLVRRTRDITIATTLGVPRSTAAGWLKQDANSVVSIELVDIEHEELEAEVAKLRRRVEKMAALLRLLMLVLRISGITLSRVRVPEGRSKGKLANAISRCSKLIPLRSALRLVGMSAARYHAWKRGMKTCELDDVRSCPAQTPQQLTAREINEMRNMATSPEYRHVPTRTLAILAARLGRVFASSSTWYRLVRERGWRRPRTRIHPRKPTIGIRAMKPNEIWHIDTSVLRLLDGTKVYLHGIIDNFSRRILAWHVADRFDTGSTIRILLEAAKKMANPGDVPTVLTDGGVENVNAKVDELIESGLLKRLIAQTELSFSNSMIEAWWRQLKNQWLHLNTLDSLATVRRLVSFYVGEHNGRLPHSAFKGQTPDEMYFGRGDAIPEELETAKREARRARLEANRATSCSVCKRTGEEVEAA